MYRDERDPVFLAKHVNWCDCGAKCHHLFRIRRAAEAKIMELSEADIQAEDWIPLANSIFTIEDDGTFSFFATIDEDE
jgi:hypothetical protein